MSAPTEPSPPRVELHGTIGQSLPRLEAREKVVGSALYTDDMTMPGMLYAAVLGSDYAHARIRSCDATAARALPGVSAVLTGDDVEMDLAGGALRDEPFLARGKVRYLGEPVAAVAACDLDTARRALRLIEIDYEPLEAVFDPEEALRDTAPVLHEGRGDYACTFERPAAANAIAHTQFLEGDVEAAWEQCDAVVENTFETPAQEHAYIEPCASLAACDGNGKITLWSSMHSVFRVQRLTAQALRMPLTKLRVIAPRVGGGFGGKCELTLQPIAVALARATGGAVRLTLAREDDIAMTKTRHASRIYMRTGARRDGTLVAREARIYLDGGAYADESPQLAVNAAYFARGPYRIENVNIASWAAYTNKVKGGAFRGFGNPQVTFAAESQLDDLARRLDLDPIDLRLRNALDSGDTWLGGQRVENGTLQSCLQAVRRASDWDRPRSGLPGRPGKRRGIGVSGVGHVSALLGGGATIRLNEDGSVTVNTGAVDVGAGEDTVLAQIAAASLGLPIEQVNYANPDTDSSPYNFQTASSRTTYTVGKALNEASSRVTEQILAHAGEMLECAAADLELRPGGTVGIRGVADAGASFAEVAVRAMYVSGGPISGSHDWLYRGDPFDPERTTVRGFAYDTLGIFTFGAQAVELEVDENTGAVEILEVWSAHDVGCAINPVSVEGQIEGAVAQGLGYALCEELVFDDGRIVNPTLMDYKIPGPADVPHAIHAIVLEHPEDSGPFGAKGVGEMGIVGVAAAVANAVRDATGARVTKIPITGERMLRALLDRDGAGKTAIDDRRRSC